VEVPFAGDEKAMLSAFLDRYRETMLWKLDGLTKEQAAARRTLRHHVAWDRREPPNYPWPEDEPDEDIDFRMSSTDTIESIGSLYEQEIARSREIVAGASLDDVSKSKDRPRSLRWIMVHMIEETARHAGHADILRELTDGAIGQ
jgi:hypothetical protein